MRYRDMASRILANSVAVDAGYKSECWHWIGNVSCRGYGRVTARRRGRHVKLLAHRASYAAFGFPALRRGQTLDHLCQLTTCVRPDHLEPCTRVENSRRRWMCPWVAE